MIPRSEIQNLITSLNTPYVRVHDMGTKLLWTFDQSTNPEAAATALNEAFNWLQAYGRVMISGATEKQYKGNWNGCYKWECLLNSNTPAQTGQVAAQNQSGSFAAQLKEMVSVMTMLDQLRGGSNNNNQNTEFMLYKQQVEFTRQIDTLKRENDGTKWITAAIPFIGKKMGMNSTEIEQTQRAISGTPSSNTVQTIHVQGTSLTTDSQSVEELKKLSAEELLKLIQGCLNSLPDKIDGVPMYMMLRTIDNNPNMVHPIINLPVNVDPQKLVRLFNAVTKNPALVDTALTFIQ